VEADCVLQQFSDTFAKQQSQCCAISPDSNFAVISTAPAGSFQMLCMPGAVPELHVLHKGISDISQQPKPITCKYVVLLPSIHLKLLLKYNEGVELCVRAFTISHSSPMPCKYISVLWKHFAKLFSQKINEVCGIADNVSNHAGPNKSAYCQMDIKHTGNLVPGLPASLLNVTAGYLFLTYGVRVIRQSLNVNISVSQCRLQSNEYLYKIQLHYPPKATWLLATYVAGTLIS
jgi:hypothetical protein